MNENEKEITTAGNASVGAEAEQSSSINNNSIIEFTPDVKPFPDQRLIQLQMQPGYIETKTMRQLYDQAFEPRVQTIDGLLCPGLYLFVGEPKIGKSFCMLQMAYKVSRGEPFLGFDVPSPSPVLYLALEDTEERLQERLFRMFGTKVTDNLHFAIRADKIDDQLIEQLKNFMWQCPGTRLIIIDTLQKTRKVTANPCNYSADYEVIGRLKTFADESKVSLILVHHMRKQESSNKTEMISGTNGLYGASDGAFLMYKKGSSDNELVIDVECRDLPPQSIRVNRDPVSLVYSRVDETAADPKPKDPIFEKVSALLSAEHPVWVGTATKLIADLGIDMKPNSLSYYLNVRSRMLYSDYRIRYEKGRTSQARGIRLTWIPPEERHDADDDNDANDDDYGNREVSV